MNERKIVARSRDRVTDPAGRPETERIWAMLGWIGLSFLVVGGLDFVLVWVPLRFGNPEWEFGTVTQSFNGLPILLLGIGLLLASSERLGRRWWGVLGAIVSLTLLIWILAGFAMWGLRIDLALSTVPPDLAFGVKKAIAKTAVQSVVYTLALAYLLLRWRRPVT